MEKHAEDARRKAMVIDIDMLVPKDHLPVSYTHLTLPTN